MVLLALSTGHKIGLAAVGVTFILFALVSSFLLPRRNPNFPGRGMTWFVLGGVALFVAMLAAVLVFGKEEKKAEGGIGKTHATPPPLGTSTNSGSGGSKEAGGGNKAEAASKGADPYANGDAAAGKKVFTTAGCSGCHTLKAAAATGNVGPNLDEKKPEESLIVERVTKGKAPMPSFKGQLSDKQIADVVAFVYTSTH